ncbi:MAG: hypothetical protein ACI97A_003888 [Planctomycetota bacterium]
MRYEILLLVALCSLTANAQTPNYTFNGNSQNDFLGASVSCAGDVNGDGFDDVVVGADGDDNNGSRSGTARVFSGLDGSLLYTFIGDDASDFLGHSVSGAGDVNADGFDDIIAGAWGDDDNGVGSGSARVFSGLDGSILYTFYGDFSSDGLGISVSDAGDVNGDGFDDVIAGAFGDDNNGSSSGSAKVYSGCDGCVLYQFNGDAPNAEFGRSVSGAGDVNSDGYDDLIVGAQNDDTNGNNSGSARVFSGVDGSILYTFFGQIQTEFLGVSVSGAGDFNRDGFDDLIVGSPFDDNNGSHAGTARVFSGADGCILSTLNGNAPSDGFGHSVSGAGDVNGDGFADVIVGAYADDNNGNNSGSAKVFFGRDGSSPYTLASPHVFSGDDIGDALGFSVSRAGDINGDGFADLIVGASADDNFGSSSGSAMVFLAPTLPTKVVSTKSHFRHFLRLDWTSGVTFSNPFAQTGSIRCSMGSPGGLGIAAASLKTVDNLLFGFLPLLVDPDPLNLYFQTSFQFGSLGDVQVLGIDLQNPALAGNFTYVQFFQTSPLVLSSNALRLEYVP